MRAIPFALLCALALQADDANPIVRSWLLNPAARSTTNPALRAVLPEVQAVRVDDRHVTVESAGLSLQSLGALTANDRVPPNSPRRFTFEFPLHPQPAGAVHVSAPLGVVGAFLNGVPIYNPISPFSYNDQNLWHLDAVASLAKNSHAPSPLLESLFGSTTQHSPLIGFALDGYPIYGPYGWDGDGHILRLRSSYRLRSIDRRATLPDGTELTPSQEGPPVNAEYPLGAFVEDYEYVPQSGDLDHHNGRFARTPEYPQGTYAYFLTTYPYLVGPTYFGAIENMTPAAVHHAPLDLAQTSQIDLATPPNLQSGRPATLNLTIRDARGRNIRFLEKVHEQPIHLLVVSTDLVEFAHIHPELQSDDTYAVTYAFPHGGTYWLYADYTRPGNPPSISRFRLAVRGDARRAEPLRPDTCFTKTQDNLQVTLTMPRNPRVGDDITFRFDVSANDLEPYLGAWAHIMILSADRQEFIHAHPLDALSPLGQHTHAVPSPSPKSITTVAGFRQPGLYRLWVQFQRNGKVITIPYTFNVAEAKAELPAAAPPPGAIRVRVSSAGFVPARISINAGKPTVLAFEREDAQNCANTVVFPDLGITRPLPAGKTVLIEIPAAPPKELSFTCGMGMFRGALLIH